ncbi:hypothetical protein Smp_004790 [Schistosoma mansoni]|uniref:hypothetical protein n=1 Tax=Schistosoma mansoni TaxID=6183 RepID=UPI0001A64585|nr:hypothetical protein Smp_004790 [Schistosoma mansoni]|eukprot:XP_018650455.1 hypothetical protein Smp_004790 [Schistosoma mansoni]
MSVIENKLKKSSMSHLNSPMKSKEKKLFPTISPFCSFGYLLQRMLRFPGIHSSTN